MKQKLFKTSLFNSPFCRNLCGCIPNISNSGAAFPPFRYGTRCDSGLSIRSALSVQCRKHIVRCRRKSAAFCDGKYGISDDEVRHFPMRSAALSHALLRGGFSGLRIRFSQSRFSPFPASVITVCNLCDFRFRPPCLYFPFSVSAFSDLRVRISILNIFLILRLCTGFPASMFPVYHLHMVRPRFPHLRFPVRETVEALC